MKKAYWEEYQKFMNKYNNPLKDRFINSFPEITIESETSKLSSNISFSFSYFDYTQAAKGIGQDFNDWSKENLVKLCNKLKQYCGNTMAYWSQMPVGSGKKRMHILEIYNKFPVNSEFERPKHVPLDVSWARFRLEGDMRLIGFVISKETAQKYDLNPNIFYIVFLDEKHQFYKTQIK